jgi:L-ascorbate metabolism protein UlaG (beta-lactamase superfamily)|nr:MBL fold metallo-hydrolase [Oxynema aestuarii]
MSNFLGTIVNRRQLLKYASLGVLSAVGTGWPSMGQPGRAQSTSPSPSPTPASNALTVQWLGHTAFLFSGGGRRVLVNPFRNLGCTAGYRPPKVGADLVLISSRLLDEGATDGLPGSPRLLYEPGAYQLGSESIQGIRTDHDLEGGRRFGINVVWVWSQAGLRIVHLGGAAAPITMEQQILIGRPDLLLLPVGGGPKAYGPEAAKATMDRLNPRLVIPTHYLTEAAGQGCELVEVDRFLSLVDPAIVDRAGGDTLQLTRESLPETGTRVKVLSYRF